LIQNARETMVPSKLEGQRMPTRRKAAHAKRASGTYRPGRQRAVPELPPGAPEPPSWLGEIAKAEWSRVTADLSAAGTLAESHRSILIAHCALTEELETSKGAMPTARLA
jgi:phage terminase small subunit